MSDNNLRQQIMMARAEAINIPIDKKYTLSVEEASQYFRIGNNKLRKLINNNKNADWILWNSNRAQIKRIKFEKYIDSINSI